MSPSTQSHDRCGVNARLNLRPHLGIDGKTNRPIWPLSRAFPESGLTLSLVFFLGDQLLQLFLGHRLVGHLGELQHEVDDLFFVDRRTQEARACWLFL